MKCEAQTLLKITETNWTPLHCPRSRNTVTSPAKVRGAEPPANVLCTLRKRGPRGGADQSWGPEHRSRSSRKEAPPGGLPGLSPSLLPVRGQQPLAHHGAASDLVCNVPTGPGSGARSAARAAPRSALKGNPKHGGEQPASRRSAAPFIGQLVWLL